MGKGLLGEGLIYQGLDNEMDFLRVGVRHQKQKKKGLRDSSKKRSERVVLKAREEEREQQKRMHRAGSADL